MSIKIVNSGYYSPMIKQRLVANVLLNYDNHALTEDLNRLIEIFGALLHTTMCSHNKHSGALVIENHVMG